MKKLGIAGGLVAIVVAAVLNGLVLKVVWGWFVSDYFRIKEITIPEALGLATLIGFLSGINRDERTFSEQMIQAFIQPLIVLALGFVYHLFM